MQFDDLPDEDVVAKAQAGCNQAVETIVCRYKPVVESRARAFFFPGADRDDVIQEGMLGLLAAIREFRRGKGSFAAFARLCCTRCIISAVKASNRCKHLPLNTYVSLAGDADESEVPLLDMLADESTTDPEEEAIARAESEDFRRTSLRLLNDYELATLYDYARGVTQAESAVRYGRSKKSIDNAIWRAKCKIRKHSECIDGVWIAPACDGSKMFGGPR